MKKQEPVVWKPKKTEKNLKKTGKKLKKGKLTFFKITSGGHDMDFLLSSKMLKYRRKSAKKLAASADNKYKKVKAKLSNAGKKKKSTKQILKLQKMLVVTKMVREQTKTFYEITKDDCKKFK